MTPIFALQYLFSIIRPLERTYQFDKFFASISYIGIIIDSSQGLIIVLMFCFGNSKVSLILNFKQFIHQKLLLNTLKSVLIFQNTIFCTF